MKQNINEELNYIKYLFGYEKGVVISEQKLLFEQEIKQGGAGDPYQYKKEGGKYFYAKKAEGTNAKWIERTDDPGLKAIKTKIFGEQPGATNQPTTNQPVSNQPVVNQPVVNQPAVNQPVTNTKTTAPTKSGSLIGKTYTFEGKTCTIEKEIKKGEGSYLILPKQQPGGCRKNNGVVDGIPGYVSLSLNDSGDGGTLYSWFTYDSKSKDFTDGPRHSLANISLK